jgi:hypothetical protein
MVPFVAVEVTQDDIDNGVAGSHTKCPIALALRRLTGFGGATVGYTSCGPYHERYYLPAYARKFIGAFDSDKPVKPFTLELTEPSHY